MIGGQYLTPSCCDSFDVLGKWPLFWQKRVKGEGGVSEYVSRHLHMDFHLYGACSAKVGNANSCPSNLRPEGSKRGPR